jgi:hypothetical protein
MSSVPHSDRATAGGSRRLLKALVNHISPQALKFLLFLTNNREA